MLRPDLEAIPHTEADLAVTQFGLEGHVAMQGLFNPELLQSAVEDAKHLASARRTHNEGQRENVTQLSVPDSQNKESLYSVLQGTQEGAAILGRALSLTHGCQLDLRQMDRWTGGMIYSHRRTLVGGIVATVALEGSSYYTVTESTLDEGMDYLVKPGDVVFEDLGKRLRHRSYTAGEDRTNLVVANTIKTLEEVFSLPDMAERQAT